MLILDSDMALCKDVTTAVTLGTWMTSCTHHPSVWEVPRHDRRSERSAAKGARKAETMECSPTFINTDVSLFDRQLAVGAVGMAAAVALSKALDECVTEEGLMTVGELTYKASLVDLSSREFDSIRKGVGNAVVADQTL